MLNKSNDNEMSKYYFAAHQLIAKSITSFAFAFLILSSDTVAAQFSDKPKAAEFMPAVLMLLDEDGPIVLKVGQAYGRVYESKEYPEGIKFQLGRLYEDVLVQLNLDGIASGTELEVYVNGALIKVLRNGVNTFVLPASGLPRNNILIKLKDGTTGDWRLTEISVFLNEGPTTRAEAQRFLARATFGPKPQELNRVLEIGYEAWIDEQLRLPRRSNRQAYIDRLAKRQAARRRELNESNWRNDPDCNRGNVATLQECIDTALAKLEGSLSGVTRMDNWWGGVINGNDQLRERVVYALSQILVASDQTSESLWQRGMTGYMDVLSTHAFGNYEELLKDVTLNPIMARYLSFVGNQKAGGVTGTNGTQPDENYAREIMQLFSIGLVELNLDGTPKTRIVDGKEVEIETYNQDTVRNLARVFTGWIYHGGTFDFDRWDLNPLQVWGDRGQFHDFGEKTLLPKADGSLHVNPAGLSVEADLDMALNNIFMHPNVGPFISTRLIERLVMSNPSPAYVERVARVFNDNGSGRRGDMAAVVKAILLDIEALNSHASPRGGKIKEPIIALAQVWRAFSARSDIDAIRYSSVARTFAQRPLSAPTVFNFYAPTDTTTSLADEDLVAPEITLLQDGNILLLLQIMRGIAASTPTGSDPLSATSFDSRDTRRAMILNLSDPKRLAHDHERLMDFFEERLFGGIMTGDLRRITIEYLNTLKDQGSDDANRRHVVEQALNIILISPEYYFQH